MNQHKQPSALKSVPTKLSSRTEQINAVNEDITTVIARLQKMRNELTAEIESLNARIDELKRTREIVREMTGSEERNV